ncbi:excinuclease ABC subunit A [Legionella geestiana]|uniref:UvrABC system protein A n=1 Tax=Legionella geestiana TaxID=45065 RepID=A0A0W0TT03_9GAMM|nr:excinuclease ABC subunit UvrA [Legionella geestiana]KTC98802.1 excinuclease ABC subunit A [Legionella geestiana]QBS12806.1 excinuclease ABC subunit UvrA [Legionella geestiana]QDQ39477.1 excinuclease ABC subunit UvrA [Legionella geestiana]STX54714.1 excinuclease ABC subunit A [Legionella geestiana]
MVECIHIRGARTHNLKNIDLDIPRNRLTVITGLSGSGKSSLAFDTLYAEGQRRYVESLSAYARQFLSMMDKPDVDTIEGLSPAISIEQKATSHNPRSTVGTITEVHDYLRLLFARVGEPRCPTHKTTLNARTVSEMVDTVLALPPESRAMILAPVVRERKGEHLELFRQLQARGYVRARINGELCELDDPPTLSLKKKHTIEVVIDRFKVREDARLRLSESFENALELAEGLAIVAPMDDAFEEQLFSSRFSCPDCGYSLRELEPRLFSFNNPNGACPACDGLGVDAFFDPERVVHDPRLTLGEGAVRGWDKRTPWYYANLESLAAHYGFNLNVPFGELAEKYRNIILYGSKEEAIAFQYSRPQGGSVTRMHPFEGIIPNMQRRYRESDSNAVRDELARYLASRPCPTCNGERLCVEARNVFVDNKTLPEISAWSIETSWKFFSTLNLSGFRGEIAQKINKEIVERLGFLVNVGLDYLSLARSAETLSGGEAQRIRLASQIGSGLVGVMYILDEPSIGLHQRDNARLLQTLERLRDLGNTVIVVEHDEDAIRAADHVIDIGPGAGVHGGELVACGTPGAIMKNKASLTGQFLSGAERIDIPEMRKLPDPDKCIRLKGVHCNNLQGVSAEIPLGLFTCVTGVSGSGKSSLINDTLFPVAATLLNRAHMNPRGRVESLTGLTQCDKVIDIDQSPIGRTPRSNPATYTGLFTPLRELFAGTPEARSRGYQPGRFSFNVRGGRCEACEGDGLIKVEMHFLPDMYVACDNCQGKRYNRETLDILYRGKSIHDVLEMTVEEALGFFAAIPAIARKCQTLMDVGLGYIRLGQSATTLSGGEAQRIKLARELSRRGTGQTLYILDEPTTGLHFYDTRQLLGVLFRLRDQGNTIVVIEHNLDVIKTADWIIDLGPEGGSRGGEIIATGTPETVAENPRSYTGHFLKPLLAKAPKT